MAGIYSVSQVNSYIKNMFAQDFALSRISVRGEVSNCKYHTSGHIYFTLKDKTGTLAAVMFAGQRRGLSFQLQEGQQVVVTGTVDVYERDGKYQLYARKIEQDGQGDLFLRFQRLRDQLEEMGMFAPEYKQPIPRYAQTVGVVQGAGAASSIVRGIQTLDEMGLDVLIVGRGGGSIEDLWAFNEEPVARAIFNCRTPVISAVGHETDVTIADYVADLRAPTPSAAAELAVFDYRQFEEQLLAYHAALRRAMGRQVERRRFQADQYRLRLQLHDPMSMLRQQRQRLTDLQDQMEEAMKRKLTMAKHRLALAGGRLHGLSPLEKISRGFGFLTDENSRRIEHAADVKPGDLITIRITDGRLKAQVIEREEINHE